jgi:hypothetical protein
MQKDNDRGDGQKQPPFTRPLWLWFVAGFCIVFAAMSFAITMYTMHSSGDAVIECKLWQYYVIEIGRAWGGRKTLGPLTGSSSATAITAFQHVLCSAIGGVGMLGVGWIVRKIRSRQVRPT